MNKKKNLLSLYSPYTTNLIHKYLKLSKKIFFYFFFLLYYIDIDIYIIYLFISLYTPVYTLYFFNDIPIILF